MIIELSGMEAVQAHLAATPKDVVKATIRAINAALGQGNTLMARLVATDTGLKVSDVKKRMYVVQASYTTPTGKLATKSLSRIPLMVFGATGPVPSRGKGRGVTARIGGSRKTYPHAFIAGVTTGHEWVVHTGVFVRVGRTRLPIKQLYGPSLGHVFVKQRPQVGARMAAVFDAELERQLQRTDAHV